MINYEVEIIERLKNELLLSEWMSESMRDDLLTKWTDNMNLSIPDDRILQQMNDFLTS